MRTLVRPVLVLALGVTGAFRQVRGIRCQGRVSQAQSETHPRLHRGLVAATRAHTAPSRGPAGGVLTPCLARGLTLCPTSALSSTGPGAASSSSSHDLRRIIHH